MDADERAIYYYVKSRRPKTVSIRDVGRHVGGKRRFHYSPDWAIPVLERMIERGILETDPEGHYRLKPIPPKETTGKHWASPEIFRILTASGKGFDNLLIAEDEDDYYDRL